MDLFGEDPRILLFSLLFKLSNGKLPRIPYVNTASRDRFSLYLPSTRSAAYKRYLNQRIRKMLKLPSGPDAVTIAVTHRCPLRCPHCSAALFNKSEELSTKDIKRLITQCVDLGCYNITFTGGEPLIREDIVDLVKYAAEQHVVVQIFTSAANLNINLLENLRKAGLSSLHISLDSPCPHEHDSLRGVEGLFDKAILTIKAARRKGISVGISTYATHQAIKTGKLMELIRLAEKLKVNEVSIFELIPTGRLLHASHNVILTDDEKNHLRSLYVKHSHDPKRVKIWSWSYIEYDVRYAGLKYLLNPEALGCLAVRYMIHITADGYVTPCDFMPLSFGNVMDEPLTKIYRKMKNHPIFRRINNSCLMQNPDFREKYLSNISNESQLPYPIDDVRPP